MSSGARKPVIPGGGSPLNRVLLKLSGEALAGTTGSAISASVMQRLAAEIATVVASGTQVAVVLGGGNFLRGAQLQQAGMNRVSADHMGMLATLMNAIAFRDVLLATGVGARVLSALAVAGIAEQFNRGAALRALSRGEVLLFGGGTGNPFFTTDTAASLRGIEIDADVVLKATKVDGIYSADPEQQDDVVRFEKLSYDAVIQNDLKVMDISAITLCRDHAMPLMVFDMSEPGALSRIAAGEQIGSLVTSHSEE